MSPDTQIVTSSPLQIVSMVFLYTLIDFKVSTAARDCVEYRAFLADHLLPLFFACALFESTPIMVVCTFF